MNHQLRNTVLNHIQERYSFPHKYSKRINYTCLFISIKFSVLFTTAKTQEYFQDSHLNFQYTVHQNIRNTSQTWHA